MGRTLPCAVAAAAAAALLVSTGASAAPVMAAGADAFHLYRVLHDDRINESSGLALSTRTTRGRLLTHNDSGDGPRVFVVNSRGATRAVWRLRGANAYDWEDIATGPRHQVWVGDIGDNSRRRDTIQVYRFREPRRVASRSVRSTRFDLRYPDGHHDAEALLVRPRSGRLYVVSKQHDHAAIYRAPRRLDPDKVNRLRRVAPAPAIVTAGAFDPGGKRLALGTYGDAHVYRRLGGRSRVIDLPSRPQGESLVFSRSGRALLVGSEFVDSRVWSAPLGG